MTYEIRIRRLSGETTSLTFESDRVDVRTIKDELCLLLDLEYSPQITLFQEVEREESGGEGAPEEQPLNDDSIQLEISAEGLDLSCVVGVAS